MCKRAQIFLLLAGAMGVSLLAGPASANTATLKCNPSGDQIWVYDSLENFNVDAKLKCGEHVEIVGRVQAYVKIRARNGVEGYIPEGAVSDLPPAESHQDSARDVGLAAKQAQAAEIAKAAANAASLAPADVNYSAMSPVSGSGPAAISASGNGGTTHSPATSLAPMNSFGALAPAPASRPAESAPSSATTTTAAPAARRATSNSISSPASSPDRATADSGERAAASASTATTASAGDSDRVAYRTTPVSEGVDLNCQSYFSAYGLTPSQTKWIAQNREKAFSRICPAPDPSKVDFVIIFTHDVDFFSSTLPNPVHKSGGFSDFTAMTKFDTALIPESQVDKARREYVWIFQFEKGTFDPASFSPERQYQFSKMETSSMGSKAGVKTVEDAFRFVALTSR